jgi:Domain of unknown function (DUF4148)
MTHDLRSSAIGAMFAFAAALAAAQTAPATNTTRAEVKAEAARARAAGELPRGEAPIKDPNFKPGKTREQRKAETRDAVAKGEVGSRGSAGVHDAPAATKTSQTSRADVKQEARAATKAGQNRGGEASPGQTR